MQTPNDVGNGVKECRRDLGHSSISGAEGRSSNVQAGTSVDDRAPPPYKETTPQDGTKMQAARRLPKLAPGQTCSIKDLKGCLAGRGPGPAPTIEEMNDTVKQAVVERYLRSFA